MALQPVPPPRRPGGARLALCRVREPVREGEAGVPVAGGAAGGWGLQRRPEGTREGGALALRLMGWGVS